MGNSIYGNRVLKNPLQLPQQINPDPNEFAYGAFFVASNEPYYTVHMPNSLLRDIDLRDHWATPYPAVLNQRKVNSCTAFAVAAAMECVSRHKGIVPLWILSPANLYHTITKGLTDQGATMLQALQAAELTGVAASDSVSMLTTWESRSTDASIRSAGLHRITRFERLRQSLDQLRCVLQSGFPILFTMAVGSRSDVWLHTEAVQRPLHVLPGSWGEQDTGSLLGAHALLLVGYSDASQLFTVRNSWGDRWGLEGHFYISYEFVIQPFWCRDFYVVLDVSE